MLRDERGGGDTGNVGALPPVEMNPIRLPEPGAVVAR
jgi:hypothetical protein